MLSQPISSKKVLNVYWREARQYKLVMFVMCATMVLAMVGDLIIPIFYKQFFDVLADGSGRDFGARELITILTAIGIIRFVSWSVYRVGVYMFSYFDISVKADLHKRTFDYLMGHSYNFFISSFSGALVQRVNRLARSFGVFAEKMYWDFLPIIIRIGGAIIALWLVQPVISMVVIVACAIFLLVSYVLALYKLRHDVAAAAADSATTATLADSIANSLNIKIFTGWSFENTKFAKVVNSLRQLSLKTNYISDTIGAVQSFFFIVLEIILFYFAIKYWRTGEFTVGTVALIQGYFFIIIDRLWDFGRVIRSVYESFADAKEMVEVLGSPYDVQNVVGARQLNVSGGEIVFENVHFRYHHNRPILRGLNLRIQSGEKIALIGPSGAGKSTVIHTLFRFFDLEQGRILIDSQNIQKVTQESLRAHLSLVPQDPVLFHRTILENIRYGRRDATDAEVRAVAKLAHCDEFIDHLPQKYETLVGERGVKLSGGERQRVAIARAMLKNAPILVLDEATSSLDSHSEVLIQDALDSLMRGKTVIVIAHRLSTIRKMDRIIVLRDGVVLEEGSHDDLLARQESLYKKLWDLQAGGFMPSP